MRQHRGRHKSVKEYRHILSLTFFTAVSYAVILLDDQLCRYQLDFFTNVFLSNNFHLTSAARADLLVFRNSAGDDLSIDILNDLITPGL